MKKSTKRDADQIQIDVIEVFKKHKLSIPQVITMLEIIKLTILMNNIDPERFEQMLDAKREFEKL